MGLEIQRLVSRAGLRSPNRSVAVQTLDETGDRQTQGARTDLAPAGRAPSPALRNRHVQHRSGVSLAQDHRAGQGAGAIGPRPAAAHDVDAVDRLGRQLTPHHPAPEGIVQGHAVQGHKGPPRPRGRDRAEREALGGGIGRRARGAPKQGDAGGVRQGFVKPAPVIQRRLVERHGGIGALGHQRRQARDGDDHLLDGGRARRLGGERRRGETTRTQQRAHPRGRA